MVQIDQGKERGSKMEGEIDEANEDKWRARTPFTIYAMYLRWTNDPPC